jgi:cytochrome c peroxidase
MASVFYLSCTKDPQIQTDESVILGEELELPDKPYNYSAPELPAFFKDQFVSIQDNTPSNNRVTDWGATLGRVLFYDKRLSVNHSISCSSCHLQEFGFTDTAILSKGFNGGLTKRHSMSLINAAFYVSGRFFWDERAATLEEQVLMPIQDPLEMGLSLDTLIARLEKTRFYPILFKKAFGEAEINQDKISKALAQFVRSMVSYRSKYDIGRTLSVDRFVAFPNFTAEENAGKDIFMGNKAVNCSGCHNTDVLILDNPRNNGISLNNDADKGIFIHTQNNADLGKFKSPSLKNVALRKNFMHDGTLRGLDKVIAHYNGQIKPNPNLDPHLFDPQTGQPLAMGLSQTEVENLKAFLETLTDIPLTTDKRYSSPFKK